MDIETQYKIQQSNDLELAVLVSLISDQNCIFSTDSVSNQSLKEELRAVCESAFGLRSATIDCSYRTTVDDFSHGVLRNDDGYHDGDKIDSDQEIHAVDIRSTPARSRPKTPQSETLDTRRSADVIIVTNLDQTDELVQVQVLELIRKKRICTGTAMHTAAHNFIVLAILSTPSARLDCHLNDLFAMSHLHTDDDKEQSQSNAKLASMHTSPFSIDQIDALRALAQETFYTPEIAAYLHDIVIFLRNSRYLRGGVTPLATRQLRIVAKALAPLHGLDYVPPSLVALAARKVYPHRVILATVETERSLLWGSDPEAIRALLDGLAEEEAVEEVLASVETPV